MVARGLGCVSHLFGFFRAYLVWPADDKKIFGLNNLTACDAEEVPGPCGCPYS